MSTPPQVPQGRLANLRFAYRMTKEDEKFLGLRLLAWFVLVGGLMGLFSWTLGSGIHWIAGLVLSIIFGFLSGLLAAMIVLGRRAEKAGYRRMEGQPGAAERALSMLRRGWFVHPNVAFNKQQDIVHRVVGRPGIILVGEGNPNRLRNLIANEKKKHTRIAGDEMPITDIVVGRGDGQVPLPKLIKRVKKLPKNLKPGELTPLLNKLKALDAMRPTIPLPKGPVPTSMKGARRMMQGR